jgi:chemotaxis protein CheZ
MTGSADGESPLNAAPVLTEQCLALAQDLVGAIETKNEAQAQRLLDELAGMRESQLFQEVGKLTRSLHEALNAFHLDDRIATLVEEEIPDARSRLDHVITMTDQAAHRTLAAVEASLPLSDELRQRAGELDTAWQRFLQREMDADEFRGLSRQIAEFLPLTADRAAVISSQLSDVLMAQDFQDLTGQIIRRVINLVQEVENSLVNLVRLAGSREQPAAPRSAGDSRLEGPAVPGVDTAGAVSGQDEVDDLLSSLGF